MSNTQYDNLCGEHFASTEREIIRIDGLNKAFGEIKAVRDLSFRVCRGELFAFLGVNGAGKSTTISIISGQLRRDGGSVTILGMDAERDFEHVSRKLGVVFQNSVLDQALTVRENLRSRAALYGINGKAFKKRLSELSELLDFGDLLNRTVGTLSGGEAQRVKLATELSRKATGRTLYILDEPTTGLDPQTRLLLWSVVMQLRAEHGLTVFLTTHYMEEAADADYVVILDSGSIAAEGTPLELKNRFTGDFITLYGVTPEKAAALGEYRVESTRDGIRIAVKNTAEATQLILKHPELFTDYEIKKGGMDDVFLAATGKKLSGGVES